MNYHYSPQQTQANINSVGQPYIGNLSAAMVTATPRESLTVIASTVNGGVRELNAKLAEFRSRLFGEGEQSAQPPDGPMPCLDVSLGGAKMGITDALSQIDRILSQL